MISTNTGFGLFTDAALTTVRMANGIRNLQVLMMELDVMVTLLEFLLALRLLG